MSLKSALKPFVPGPLIRLRQLYKASRPTHEATCPICGYRGYFRFFGSPPRPNAFCPGCHSLERHRLLWLSLEEDVPLREPVLHFAPEAALERRLRARIGDYTTADISGEGVDRQLNIEALALQDGSQGTIICNHVLEHVDDHRALRELHRVLRKDGVLVLSFPLVEGWSETYEPPGIEGPEARHVHFGQHDHVRFYGRDVRDRIRAAGFAVQEITAGGAEAVAYNLMRGEKVFLCRKAA
jgi:hypothetical protein